VPVLSSLCQDRCPNVAKLFGICDEDESVANLKGEGRIGIEMIFAVSLHRNEDGASLRDLVDSGERLPLKRG
jgi:hypothetical protein